MKLPLPLFGAMPAVATKLLVSKHVSSGENDLLCFALCRSLHDVLPLSSSCSAPHLQIINLFPPFLFIGGNCRCYAFCSRDCQALFWKAGGHKKVCNSLKAMRESGSSVAEIRGIHTIPGDDDINNDDINKVPLQKPSRCSCSIKGCKCEMKEGDPVALYRQLDGERFFTGMVATCGVESLDFSKVRKLHNAGGDLEGVSSSSCVYGLFVNIYQSFLTLLLIVFNILYRSTILWIPVK